MNDVMYVGWNDGTSLYHYGIQGQKWGNRRYQNPDGSLTAEGRIRYGIGQTSMRRRTYESFATKKAQKGTKEYESNKAYDKKITDYYKRAGVGKAIVKDLLLGTSGTMTYNMARAVGERRGKAWVRSWFDINLGMLPTIAFGPVGKIGEMAIRNSGEELSLQQRALRKKANRKYS